MQCKKGYLLDDMDRYDVYRPLCEINGYDEDTCPTDGILSWSGIMSWSACQMFGYVCKFCLVCSNEIYKASNSIYICFIKGAGILGLQLILLIWAAGCNCSNIVKVIMSAEAVLEIFSIVALIILFQMVYPAGNWVMKSETVNYFFRKMAKNSKNANFKTKMFLKIASFDRKCPK